MPPSSVLNNIEYRSHDLRNFLKEQICAELGWSLREYYDRLKEPDVTNHKTGKTKRSLTQDERVRIQAIARRILAESRHDITKPAGYILLRELQNNILIREIS